MLKERFHPIAASRLPANPIVLKGNSSIMKSPLVKTILAAVNNVAPCKGNRVVPLPEVNRYMNDAELIRNIPRLQSLSPVLVSMLKQDYKNKGGLTCPAAIQEMRKSWEDHFKTERMLKDLRKARLATFIDTALEIPIKLMATYERWVGLQKHAHAF